MRLLHRSYSSELDSGDQYLPFVTLLRPLRGVTEGLSTGPPLDGFLFSRVFVLTYLGVYHWRRGGGWCKLTGHADTA
jgi:hypothetical protein